MADKTIGELPEISYLDSGSLFVAEQNGEAVKVSGKQLTDFSNVETTAQVEQAKTSAQEAQAAKEAAEAAILKGPIIQNGTWWVYNQTAGAYQDTGINATGPKGDTGPTSSVNNVSPDSNGNIMLTAGNVGAYSKSESDTLLANKVNPNLLDNPWFTVNQRGVSSHTSNNSYGVDRWKCTYADNVSINSNNEITLDGTKGHYAALNQLIEKSSLNLIGKQVTLSFLTTSGDVKSASFTVRDSVENYYYVDNEHKEAVCIDTRTSNYVCYVLIIGKSVTLRAIKLELGSVSTLAYDTPPNYQQELAKCQRYFQIIPRMSAIGVNVWTTSLEVYYSLPTTMRTIPSATLPSDLTNIVRESGNKNLTPTSVYLSDAGYLSPEFISIVIRGDGMTAGRVYTIAANIPLSADL